MSAQAIHEAADALVAYARDTFWRDDSAFQRSSRHSYEAAAVWLHEYADGVTAETAMHLFSPASDEDSLSLCRDEGPTTTTEAEVTCGWCRIRGAS